MNLTWNRVYSSDPYYKINSVKTLSSLSSSLQKVAHYVRTRTIRIFRVSIVRALFRSLHLTYSKAKRSDSFIAYLLISESLKCHRGAGSCRSCFPMFYYNYSWISYLKIFINFSDPLFLTQESAWPKQPTQFHSTRILLSFHSFLLASELNSTHSWFFR